METKVSVGIITFNSADDITECIKSLTPEVDEIIVVDNASKDSTCIMAKSSRQDMTINVIELDKNVGFGQGCNIALEQAKNEFVLILNPDVRMTDDALLHLINGFNETTAVSVPRIEKNSNLQYSLRKFPTPLRSAIEAIIPGKILSRFSQSEVITDIRQYDYDHTVDWATGACWLIHKPTLSMIGNYSPKWFLYSEETDLAYRIRQAGKTIEYIHEACVFHRSGDQHSNPDLYTLAQVNKLIDRKSVV